MIELNGSAESKQEKKWGEGLSGVFDCLAESEELFLNVLLPLVCVAAICVLGWTIYQAVNQTGVFDAASQVDLLSIDPDKWFRS